MYRKIFNQFYKNGIWTHKRDITSDPSEAFFGQDGTVLKAAEDDFHLYVDECLDECPEKLPTIEDLVSDAAS